jgi:hypothetical protein
MKNLRIGFIGNFVPSFSTENDRKWSFERLGHVVIPYQESRTTIQQLSDDLDKEKFDVLFYSHTHGWEIPFLREVFARCKMRGVPTVSVHLDRWAWLDRVKDVGTEATWFTEYLFMADGSPEAVKLYEEHSLNWHYLKPGVVERECELVAPDPALFPYEIVFVGSKGYHKEYPFRPKLIEFLTQTYGDRFGHYGNDGLGVIRGKALNVLMATAKVVVGDSCFGGRPNYVSDRYYETRGRGGFLLHPKIEGVDDVGVGHYGGSSHDQVNLDSLKTQIDYYLSNPIEREKLQEQGFNWVTMHETYTDRAQEMLNIIFPDKNQ